MKNRSPIFFLITILLGISFVLLGCSEKPVSPPVESTAPPLVATEAPMEATESSAAVTLNRDPKTLVISMFGNPGELDPASAGGQNEALILFATSEQLIRAKATNIEEYEPMLAERWEVNENNTVWTFYLRNNAKFHDGTPVNAEAVKYSLTRLIKLKLGLSTDLGQIVPDPDNQIIVKDAYTLEFQLSQPSSRLIKALASGGGPYIISPTAVKNHEKDNDMAREWLKTNEAGSGPYILTESSPDQQYVLERFKDWWGWDDKWHFDKVLIKIIPEETTRRSLLETGDIDIGYEFGPETWVSFQKNPDLVQPLSPGLAIEYIYLGTYGPMKDPRVRQALSYAFDYKGYVDKYWSGLAPRARGPFPSSLQCFDPDVFTYETDLEKANQLLEEAGFDKSVELRYLIEESLHVPAGQILQAQLAKIGVNLKVDQRESATVVGIFFGDVQWPERPEMFGWTTGSYYNDPFAFSFPTFYSKSAGSKGSNPTFYSNPRVDEIIDQSLSVTDPVELCNLYKEMQDILTRVDPYMIPLMVPPDDSTARIDIGGFILNPEYRANFDIPKLYRIGY
jgi:peptide/nickel transport system substrate-binding protein